MTILDGGGVEQDAPEVLDPVTNPYGVTVVDVRNLATHLSPDPALLDPDFRPTRSQITDDMVRHWIELVSDSVRTRIAMLNRFEADPARWQVIVGAGRTAVTNGAAAYLVSAAFPAKAGTNDQTSYSAELWRRYEAELGLIIDLGKSFDADDTIGGVTPGISPVASANRPSVRDGSGFFATDPAYPPYLDPNRMHPYKGGYPAPGAEGYWY